ncbi:MAG: hypothetical protein ABIR32_07655 [Ilumatobacteraceae bacterium]
MTTTDSMQANVSDQANPAGEANWVIVAGAAAVQSGAAPTLRDIADRTDIGIFNTWGSKGLFPWNHPAHLGTIGLQERDVELAGLAGFDMVVLCGVTDDELDRDALTAAGVAWRDVMPVDIGDERLPGRTRPTPRPPLYDALAAVCQPLYADDTTPVNPARAAADLASLLPDSGVVAADTGRVGFWLGRTFPTTALGSMQLPIRPTSGFAVTQALMARRTGRFGIAVLDAIDDVSRTVIDRAKDLVIEVWTSDGPARCADERKQAILDAHDAGGVHVLQLGVRFSEIDALVAVAGAPRWGA